MGNSATHEFCSVELRHGFAAAFALRESLPDPTPTGLVSTLRPDTLHRPPAAHDRGVVTAGVKILMRFAQLGDGMAICIGRVDRQFHGDDQ
jgi:hypothetical protein